MSPFECWAGDCGKWRTARTGCRAPDVLYSNRENTVSSARSVPCAMRTRKSRNVGVRSAAARRHARLAARTRGRRGSRACSVRNQCLMTRRGSSTGARRNRRRFRDWCVDDGVGLPFERVLEHLLDPAHRMDLEAVLDLVGNLHQILDVLFGNQHLAECRRDRPRAVFPSVHRSAALRRASVISPVIATSARTGMSVRTDTIAVQIAVPALGPSLGVAPSGRWMCRSVFW